jgi:hypothetical protein
MYKVATFLVERFWGNVSDMGDGLGVLLLTWNAGFYRYGSLNFASLQGCIEKNLQTIEAYSKENIVDIAEADRVTVTQLFNDFLLALRRPEHKKSPEAFSPVATAKALHILAPNFFPLWDGEIAKSYPCYWYVQDKGAAKYWQFMTKMKRIVEALQEHLEEVKAISERPILKLTDEYNYSKFSKANEKSLQ